VVATVKLYFGNIGVEDLTEQWPVRRKKRKGEEEGRLTQMNGYEEDFLPGSGRSRENNLLMFYLKEK
jgi:hypothetical protein